MNEEWKILICLAIGYGLAYLDAIVNPLSPLRRRGKPD